ncbi:hypothetical protein MNBD_NITROSPIRAE01-990 [hydrothermal vent metagenome]|uniref:PilZ domain-containing protein n=1 Tax=hydrothermal vent metagenome TaxID=652676 RepID=A0A3B1DXB6_9ZZZZ
MQEERREDQRSTFHLRTEVLPREGKTQINLLRANIGFGGIGGFTRDEVEGLGLTDIRVYFSQRSGELKSETVSGKIVWEKQDGNFRALGISFSALTHKEHPLLISYLQYADQFD